METNSKTPEIRGNLELRCQEIMNLEAVLQLAWRKLELSPYRVVEDIEPERSETFAAIVLAEELRLLERRIAEPQPGAYPQ